MDIEEYRLSYTASEIDKKLTSEEFIRNLLGVTPVEYKIGSITSSGGGNIDSTTRFRSEDINFDESLCIYLYPGYKVYLHFYNDSGYVSNTNGWINSNIKLSDYSNIGATKFKIVVAKTNDATITEDEISTHIKNIVLHIPGQITKKLYQDNNVNKYLEFFNYLDCGLPILYLNGDTTYMTKDNSVSLQYQYLDYSGTCTCKWQGSSSVRLGYPKRNYTIKFDSELNIFGTEQKKYCMKANWIDPSAARNIVNAKLWGQVVASRSQSTVVSSINDNRLNAPNFGAIDGFPIIIIINGVYTGLYTFNIPKDDWMMGMGNGTNEYLLAAESNSLLACKFKDIAVCDESDFSIEYKTDGIDDAVIVESFNALISKAMNAGENWEEALSDCLDVDSVIDYFIFINCIGGHDNLGKNILYGTYDGTKWFMSAYDLDTTYGSNPYGSEWFKIVNDRNQFQAASGYHKLAKLMYTYSKEKLKNRYKELRANILSDENVWFTFNNFINTIPKGLYNLDSMRWSTMPSTSTANISTYMDFYRMHCAYLDKEVESM